MSKIYPDLQVKVTLEATVKVLEKQEGRNLGEAAGQTRIGAETEEVRAPSWGEVSAAAGSLFSDNLYLLETVSSASLSTRPCLVVETR